MRTTTDSYVPSSSLSFFLSRYAFAFCASECTEKHRRTKEGGRRKHAAHVAAEERRHAIVAAIEATWAAYCEGYWGGGGRDREGDGEGQGVSEAEAGRVTTLQDATAIMACELMRRVRCMRECMNGDYSDRMTKGWLD